MALATDCCVRWHCRHQPLVVALKGWSRYRLPLVSKRVVFSTFGQRQKRRVVLGHSNQTGVNTTARLKRNRLQSKLNGLNPFSESGSSSEVSDRAQEEHHRPPFDLDLAVLLAGFAFESYNTPAKNAGVLETDGGDTDTIYLSRGFIKSIYDGQLLVNLKKGVRFPGLDLWGTSDPYVEFRIGDCCVRSRTIWANKDPVWNENLTLNIKTSAGQNLKVAAWDANMVTSKRRMGNTAVSLDSLCDGQRHNLELNLEGIGGGATLFFQVQFKSFAQIESERNQFSIEGLFSGELLANAYQSIFGENAISVGEFMGDFMSISNAGSDLIKPANEVTSDTSGNPEPSAQEQKQLSQITAEGPSPKDGIVQKGTSEKSPEDVATKVGKEGDDGEVEIWENLADSFSRALKPFGIDMSGILKDKEAWEDVKSVGLESQMKAEALYAESGLAVVEDAVEDSSTKKPNGSVPGNDSDSSPVGKELLEGLLKQTEGIVGAWAIFNRSQGENQSGGGQEKPTQSEAGATATTSTKIEKTNDSRKKQEEADGDMEADENKTKMFSTGESAMEAWALLATTLGGTSFVKSDFEKICFVENIETDTQVAIWRDLRRQRLVVAFRGTEQTKWKDVVTDLNLLAAGFNAERVLGRENPQHETLVHSGFLKAYDSVKIRIMSLVQAFVDSSSASSIELLGGSHWHVYVTGHSLGGALATLCALELSSSKLAKNQHLKISMYNYGSPRVGNRMFADNYNKIVEDSWRVVNHRDIVPTVPRLMGYCHVAQPIYLSTENSPVSELLDDGYHGDVIGEATADTIIDKFMKGEQTLLQKLINTEIAMLRAMRDGSAVMQHMEDFYYITLLQVTSASKTAIPLAGQTRVPPRHVCNPEYDTNTNRMV